MLWRRRYWWRGRVCSDVCTAVNENRCVLLGASIVKTRKWFVGTRDKLLLRYGTYRTARLAPVIYIIIIIIKANPLCSRYISCEVGIGMCIQKYSSHINVLSRDRTTPVVECGGWRWSKNDNDVPSAPCSRRGRQREVFRERKRCVVWRVINRIALQ